MKVFCSWSGGKDSALACYRAKQQGCEVAYLLTILATTGRYSRSHRLSREILLAQAEAVEIATHHRCASWNTYEKEFNKALSFFRNEGIARGVFGDLDLEEHRKWVQGRCARRDIMPLFPLWNQKREGLLRQLVEVGFEAVVIAIKDNVLDRTWLGRRIDEKFIDAEQEAGIDVCGENGEYHTLVVDGPIFSKKIHIGESRTVRRDGMNFLKIADFKLEEKGNG